MGDLWLCFGPGDTSRWDFIEGRLACCYRKKQRKQVEKDRRKGKKEKESVPYKCATCVAGLLPVCAMIRHLLALSSSPLRLRMRMYSAIPLIEQKGFISDILKWWRQVRNHRAHLIPYSAENKANAIDGENPEHLRPNETYPSRRLTRKSQLKNSPKKPSGCGLQKNPQNSRNNLRAFCPMFNLVVQTRAIDQDDVCQERLKDVVEEQDSKQASINFVLTEERGEEDGAIQLAALTHS